MEINKINTLPLLFGNQERNNFFLLNWSDTKLEITDSSSKL